MKLIKILLCTLLIILLSFLGYAYSQFTPVQNPEWGVSFSIPHAQYLGFDWKTMYLDILNDLKPKNMRLIAYWETLERERGVWTFQDMHEMLDEADKRDVKIVLTLGQKVPRWPECHHPNWYNDLTQEEKDSAQLKMVERVVGELKKHKSIEAWQVENEPLFSFGPDCPVTPKSYLKQEIDIVKSLDDRPIILTDSGEPGLWLPLARMQPDIFGSTMYRVVYNDTYGSYFEHAIPPQFYKLKAGITNLLTGTKRYRGMELQAEPWFHHDIRDTGMEVQYTLMNPKILHSYAEYATKVGFETNYFWGVEWWYWLAKEKNDWGMWNEAKQILAR